jgi:porin
MTARYAELFLNGGFGDIPTENVNTFTPVYPLAAPGIYFEGKPSDAFTLRLGAYSGNAGQDVAGNHGFGWEFGNNAGYAFYGEAALHAKPWNLEGNLALGGYYVAGDFLEIGTDREVYGNYDVYVMLDQAIVDDAAGKPKLGAFARFSVSPQKDRNLAFVYGDAGFNLFTPFASRPDDVVGLGFGILRASGKDLEDPDAPLELPDGQAVVELTYQAAVTPWLTVQPDFQVIIDPVFSRSDAYAFGVQSVILF